MASSLLSEEDHLSMLFSASMGHFLTDKPQIVLSLLSVLRNS